MPSEITSLVSEIPYHMAFAGGWIDQPFVSKLNPAPPGSMVVVGLEPTFRFMDRWRSAQTAEHQLAGILKASSAWRRNIMRRKVLIIVCFFATAVAGTLTPMSVMVCSHQASPSMVQQQACASALPPWGVQHDRNAPQPPVINPGEASTQEQPGKPPSDAIILFDGKDLAGWESLKGGPAEWKVEKGYLEVVPGTGDIKTKRAFGDCQLHVEWATPSPPHGQDQDRGNSGVFLMSLYEVQVLDSYESKTYPDGQAAAIYGQYAPLVNACRPPGQWQSYDIIFHGPRFDPAGKVVRPATFTVLHNGVLVQDHVAVLGLTHGDHQPYRKTPTKLPLELQDHNHPVRFRNIWIRELPESP